MVHVTRLLLSVVSLNFYMESLRSFLVKQWSDEDGRQTEAMGLIMFAANEMETTVREDICSNKREDEAIWQKIPISEI